MHHTWRVASLIVVLITIINTGGWFLASDRKRKDWLIGEAVCSVAVLAVYSAVYLMLWCLE